MGTAPPAGGGIIGESAAQPQIDNGSMPGKDVGFDSLDSQLRNKLKAAQAEIRKLPRKDPTEQQVTRRSELTATCARLYDEIERAARAAVGFARGAARAAVEVERAARASGEVASGGLSDEDDTTAEQRVASQTRAHKSMQKVRNRAASRKLMTEAKVQREMTGTVMPTKLEDAKAAVCMIKNTEVPTGAHADLITRAASEQEGRLIKRHDNTGSTSKVCCCKLDAANCNISNSSRSTNCNHRAKWTFVHGAAAAANGEHSEDSEDESNDDSHHRSSPAPLEGGRWRLNEHVGHSCNAPKASVKSSNCNLQPSHLVPVVLSAVKQTPDVAANDLWDRVAPCVREKWSASKLRRLKELTRQLLGTDGNAAVDISAICAVASKLEEMGHHAKVHTIDADELRNIAVKTAKSDWDWKEKKRVKNHGSIKCKAVPFDEDVYKQNAVYTSITDGVKHYHSFEYAPPPNIPGGEHCNDGALWGRFDPISDSDMAFCSSVLAGQMHLRMVQDANRHGVNLIGGHVIGNETQTSHRVFDKATKTVCGEDYDCEGTVDVMDGDKGGDESYAITFQKAMNHYCFHHLKENVMKHGSNADTGLHTLGTDAPSVSGVDDAVAKMSDKARVFLGKKRQTSVWPACAAEAGVKLMGRKASQTAESHNKSMLLCRSLLPAKMLLEMAQCNHKKYHERREKAMNCTASVPPKVAEALKDAAGFAKRYTDIGNNLDGTYWVKSMTVGSDTVYTVRYNEDEGTCDCSCGRKDVIDKYICGHVAAVLDKNGLALDRFVRDEVKTSHWKKQYKNTYEVPATIADCLENYERLPASEFAFPPVAPTPKGRPTKKRVQSAIELGSKKRKVHCSRCGRAGHTKKNCKGISEPTHYGVKDKA